MGEMSAVLLAGGVYEANRFGACQTISPLTMVMIELFEVDGWDGLALLVLGFGKSFGEESLELVQFFLRRDGGLKGEFLRLAGVFGLVVPIF